MSSSHATGVTFFMSFVGSCSLVARQCMTTMIATDARAMLLSDRMLNFLNLESDWFRVVFGCRNNSLYAWSPDPLSLEIEGCGLRD